MKKTEKNRPDILGAIQTLKDYKNARVSFESRLMREREYWRGQYSSEKEGSSWLFNSIVSKHADVLDNVPVATCLARECGDEKDAEILSKIIPVITDRCDFEHTYSENSWQKLKHGTAVYGVFWNSALSYGDGDIDIRRINIDNVFWEPGIEDIEDSRNVFVTAVWDIDKLCAAYPDIDYRTVSAEAEDIGGYIYGEKINTSEKCAVVDWYYKIRHGEKEILHYCKFVGNHVIYSSEQDDECSDGWYEHGKYPIVIDRLYPCDGELYGFGYLAIGRPSQDYIDRLDKNLLDYTEWASRVRFWAKKSLGVNAEEFSDLSKSIVEVEGDIDEEKLRQIEIRAIDDSVIDVKKLKIEELKETTGSRDVTIGQTSGGVTAASAIKLLQDAGAKFSRDGIENSRRAYIKIIALVIELIRQFYDRERSFRIIGEDGEECYLGFDGSRIKQNGARRPYFDIEIQARKRSPSERESLNSFAKDLYDSGALSPENAEQTLIMLELMDFEGIGKLRRSLRECISSGAKNDKSKI